MPKPSHTPGPWQDDVCLDANGFHTIRQDDGTPNGDTDTQPIATAYTAANARLIAAAPSLADALRDLLQLLADDHDGYMADHDADMNDPGEMPHTPECVICSARALLTSLEA
jgi:hypothetical protein